MLRPIEGLDLVEAVPMFELPFRWRSRSGSPPRSAALCVAEGETIVRVGEPGDRYGCRTGPLVIDRDGDQVLKPKGVDYFGEVAIVQDVPRTATVRAVVRSELYALGRRAFVGLLSRGTRHGRLGATGCGGETGRAGVSDRRRRASDGEEAPLALTSRT